MEFLQHPSLISELKAVADGVSFGHVCAYTKTHDVELIDIQGQVGQYIPSRFTFTLNNANFVPLDT